MRWLLLLVILTAGMSGVAAAEEEVGAKAMFRDPSLGTLYLSGHEAPKPSPEPKRPVPRRPGETRRKPVPKPPAAVVPKRPAPKAEPVRSIGMRYWVQKVDSDGRVVAETAVGQIFRSGESIQLLIESNTEGYLAIVQQGSDGRLGLLFPGSESDFDSHRVLAHSRVVIPEARKAFTFDEKIGTEKLWLTLVQKRQDLEGLPLRRRMELSDLAPVRELGEKERGAKNLFIESLDDPQEDPATYVVNRIGGAIVQEIALVHER